MKFKIGNKIIGTKSKTSLVNQFKAKNKHKILKKVLIMLIPLFLILTIAFASYITERAKENQDTGIIQDEQVEDTKEVQENMTEVEQQTYNSIIEMIPTIMAVLIAIMLISTGFYIMSRKRE